MSQFRRLHSKQIRPNNIFNCSAGLHHTIIGSGMERDGHESWVNDLFDWVDYTDAITGSVKYHPQFLAACFCPCVVIGRTQTILENETICETCSSCQLGPQGCLSMFCVAICNCFIPFPFSPAVACWTIAQRVQIINQFNIEGGYTEILKGCCCPCAIFQQFRFATDYWLRKVNHVSASSAKKSEALNSRLTESIA